MKITNENNIIIFIGIDPSINSTGLVLDCYQKEDDVLIPIKRSFYNIKGESTKKEQVAIDKYMNETKSIDRILHIIKYDKLDANFYNRKNEHKDSIKFELYKTINIQKIAKEIKNCIIRFCNIVSQQENKNPAFFELNVCIEANSFNSRGTSVSLIDLAGLNYTIRNTILQLHGSQFAAQPNLMVTPPTEIKKFATGRGDADKDLIEYVFKLHTDSLLYNILKENNLDSFRGIKLDDVADAYFMCNYARKLWSDVSSKQTSIELSEQDQSLVQSYIKTKAEAKHKEQQEKLAKQNHELMWDVEMESFANELDLSSCVKKSESNV